VSFLPNFLGGGYIGVVKLSGGGYSLWGFIIAVLLTSFVRILEGGSTFITPLCASLDTEHNDSSY
jgi:hypothetical protein